MVQDDDGHYDIHEMEHSNNQVIGCNHESMGHGPLNTLSASS